MTLIKSVRHGHKYHFVKQERKKQEILEGLKESLNDMFLTQFKETINKE